MFVQSTSYNRILVADSEFLYDTGETGARDDADVPSASGTVTLFHHPIQKNSLEILIGIPIRF